MCTRTLTAVVVILLFSSLAASAESLPVVPETRPTAAEAPKKASEASKSYYLEISISGNRLTLFERNGDGGGVALARYPVGTAVRGLATYPLGEGRVTGIYFNPWWYPTPYSRQVFRERGIELPNAVPPGDPLNYMGPFKIALSHRTWKGAIYRIHGNNNPKRVGRRVTGGCFVMNNDEGLALAHKIKVGTEVRIIP